MKHQILLVFLAGVLVSIGECNESEIEPLCENEDDMESCVRDYFGHFGNCTVVTEENRKHYKPMIIKGNGFGKIPNSNSTLILNYAFFSQFNGSLETFHKNKKTQELVMSIHLKPVRIDVKDGTLYINRRSEVPQRVQISSFATHNVVITVMLPFNQEITARGLRKAMMTPYFPESYAIDMHFELKNPNDASDPKVMATLQSLMSQEPTTVKELIVTGARYIFREYLEKNICMFGNPYEEGQ